MKVCILGPFSSWCSVQNAGLAAVAVSRLVPATDGDDGLVAHTIGAPVHDVLYADNTVRGGDNGDGMQLAVGNYPVYDLVGIRTGYYVTGSLMAPCTTLPSAATTSVTSVLAEPFLMAGTPSTLGTLGQLRQLPTSR